MLSRVQYNLIQLGSLAAFVAFGSLVWWLVDSLAVGGVAGCIVAFVANVLTQQGSGGGSYREYLRAQGAPVPPPSRFWATWGQGIVVVAAALSIAFVTPVAERAPEGSWWRVAAMLVWIVAPTLAIIFLLGARERRRELSRSLPSRIAPPDVSPQGTEMP